MSKNRISKYVNMNDYNDAANNCVDELCPHYDANTDSCSLTRCNYYDYKEKKQEEE